MAGAFSLGGLSSGLDTAALIDQLMSIERRPQVRLRQQQLVEEARQSVLRDVKTRLSNLSTAAAALRDSATWADVQTVKSSDDTRVTATRTGGAAAGAYLLRVTQLASADQITQNTAITQAAQADKLRIAVGSDSVDVDIAASDSLETIASKINGSSDIPVYATVLNGKLVLSGKTTGDAATIAVTDGDTTNGYDLAADLFGGAPLTHRNADPVAEVSTDGGTTWTATSSTTNTVNDLIAGVSLTLAATTSSNVTITVGAPSPDTEKVKTKIQAFVDQYNSTTDFIRSKLTEKKVANPQTSADRVKGVVSGDAALSGLLSKLRQSVADVFTGRDADYDQLTEVGLSTGATTGSGSLDSGNVQGRLVLDATKLTEKLTADFDEVKALFTNVTNAYATEGLGQRMDRQLSGWLTGDGTNAGLLDSRLSTLDSRIADLKDRQDDFDIRLKNRERALRAQFAALETALSRAQAQGNWLSGQLRAL